MRYLVATDGSTVSDTAVEHAAVEASVWDADLEIVRVLTPATELVEGDIVLTGEDMAIERAEQTLDQAERMAQEAAQRHGGDIEIRSELLTGRPADASTEHAELLGVSGVYVGHRGLSEKHEQVVGSVAKSVVDEFEAKIVPITGEQEEKAAEQRAYAEEVAGEVADVAAEAGVECVTAVRTGVTHREIVDYIEDEDVEMVVMGSRGRSNLEEMLLGSTADKVVRSVDIPVTVVHKQPSERLDWMLRGQDTVHE